MCASSQLHARPGATCWNCAHVAARPQMALTRLALKSAARAAAPQDRRRAPRLSAGDEGAVFAGRTIGEAFARRASQRERPRRRTRRRAARIKVMPGPSGPGSALETTASQPWSSWAA